MKKKHIFPIILGLVILFIIATALRFVYVFNHADEVENINQDIEYNKPLVFNHTVWQGTVAELTTVQTDGQIKINP